MENTSNIVAPENWQENLQWFEAFSYADRMDFAVRWCSHVWSWNGQACVVVGYPRKSGRVPVYDMDGGELHWMSLEDVARCMSEETYRASEESDFEWSGILSSDVVDEAGDIAASLFG